MINSYIKLHFIVLIYGFTAILGKVINLPATHLVWYRMLISAIAFLLFFKISKINFSLTKKETYKVLGIGLIVGAHWITFFGAIKISNISVTLGCISSMALFTSIIEPIVFKRKVDALEIIIGIVIIIGLYIIFRFETNHTAGIITALTSSLLAVIFNVLNKKLVKTHQPSIISFYEMLGGLLGITIFLLLSGDFPLQLPPTNDLAYLLILGVICTAYAFAVQVKVMQKLSAYIVSLTINLEPVYGITLAWLLFRESEQMTPGFYLGTSIILLAIFGHPIFKHKKATNKIFPY